MRTVTLCAVLVCLLPSSGVAQPVAQTFDIRAAAAQAPDLKFPEAPKKLAFQALEHLQRFDFVDQNRVGLMGFSWGAMVGLLASSRSVAATFSPSRRFASVVSFYPAC